MKKIGVMIVFNEAEYIQKALYSLALIVDEIVIIDGPYRDYPHTSVASTDGTLDLIEAFAKRRHFKVTLEAPKEAWPTQVEKRSAYLKYGDVGDLFFLCDGDWQPVLLDSGQLFEDQSIQTFRGSIVKPDGKGGVVVFHFGNPLIFRKVPGIHYQWNHYSLYDGQNRSLLHEPYKIIDFYTAYQVFHIGEFRSLDRLKNNFEYYRKPLEYASGLESNFYCCDCKTNFMLKQGELIQCPKCVFGRAQTYVEDKPAS